MSFAASVPAEDPFPSYESLTANVVFWKKVYTQYSSSRGFVHDSEDLSIIYTVVKLLDESKPGAHRKNQKAIKEAREKYAKILQNLAKKEPAETNEEKRVLALWGENASPQRLKRASEKIRFQLCIRDRFKKGLERSGRYLPFMKEIFKQEALPVDLVYLPHVESSFDYTAYSKFGAAGIWQFIRSTGKRFLNIDYVVDERRDPLVATRAAARYLKENFQKLKSWPLALTAYNHGVNGMLRAQKQCDDFEQVLCEYESRSFGFASKNFYAQFLAARAIAKDPKPYFNDLQMESALASITFPLKGYVALDGVVEHLGIALSVIKELNPAFRPPVYAGEKYIPKGYVLRLPQDQSLVKKIAQFPEMLWEKEQKRSLFYRVQRGDTAGQIARQHRVSLHELVASNNLDRSARIFVGQNLIIPNANGSKNVPFFARSSKTKPSGPRKRKIVDHEAILEKELQQTASVSEKSIQPKKVKRVAKTVRTESSKSATDVKNVLVSAEESAVEKVDAKELLAHSNIILGDFYVEKIVQKGKSTEGMIRVEAWETLGHYAEWLGVPTQQIRRLNKLRFGQPILTGQTITIPLSKTTPSRFEEQRYEFHKGMEEDFFSVYKVVETKEYVVQKGDTIWELCNEDLDLPFWLLKKYNVQHTITSLKTNQVLIIPVVEKMRS